jgi:hypothetical protein
MHRPGKWIARCCRYYPRLKLSEQALRVRIWWTSPSDYLQQQAEPRFPASTTFFLQYCNMPSSVRRYMQTPVMFAIRKSLHGLNNCFTPPIAAINFTLIMIEGQGDDYVQRLDKSF